LADELLAAALTAIGRKERTEAEMRAWLEEREVGLEEQERVMSWLVENLALDDRRFAIGYAEDKRRLSGWGRDRIEKVLRDRGVPRDLIEVALAQDQSENEVDRATRVLLERGGSLEEDKDRQRALGLLARRGFCAEDAYAAIRRAAKAGPDPVEGY
jgi:regulatory protein